MKARDALGRPGHEAAMTDARFDYATIEVRGRGGRLRYESVSLPDEPNRSGGRRLVGSVKTQDPTPLNESPSNVVHSPPNDVRAPEEES